MCYDLLVHKCRIFNISIIIIIIIILQIYSNILKYTINILIYIVYTIYIIHIPQCGRIQ